MTGVCIRAHIDEVVTWESGLVSAACDDEDSGASGPRLASLCRKPEKKRNFRPQASSKLDSATGTQSRPPGPPGPIRPFHYWFPAQKSRSLQRKRCSYSYFGTGGTALSYSDTRVTVTVIGMKPDAPKHHFCCCQPLQCRLPACPGM
jgi:hypothetical protein